MGLKAVLCHNGGIMSHRTQHTTACTQSADNNRKLEISQSKVRRRVFDMWNMTVNYVMPVEVPIW